MSARQSDWPQRITIDPRICSGRPTIRGLRITVQAVLEFLAAGETAHEILHAYPSLEMEDILACISVAVKI